jgi:hypothetical protein
MLINYGRNEAADLKQLAISYGLDAGFLIAVTAICTDHYYKNFSKSRVIQLSGTDFLKVLCN